MIAAVMRYKLRTLMVALTLMPPVIAFAWLEPQHAGIIALISVIWIAEVVEFLLVPLSSITGMLGSNT